MKARVARHGPPRTDFGTTRTLATDEPVQSEEKLAEICGRHIPH